jgi:hypothetical protein
MRNGQNHLPVHYFVKNGLSTDHQTDVLHFLLAMGVRGVNQPILPPSVTPQGSTTMMMMGGSGNSGGYYHPLVDLFETESVALSNNQQLSPYHPQNSSMMNDGGQSQQQSQQQYQQQQRTPSVVLSHVSQHLPHHYVPSLSNHSGGGGGAVGTTAAVATMGSPHMSIDSNNNNATTVPNSDLYQTLFHLGAKYSPKSMNPRALSLLLQYCDQTLKDANGFTPADYLIQQQGNMRSGAGR